ncbi:DUF4838 domain-containing protein [candidate division KSB1 bacterium]|nr:DUF4838 domain-containing protein [candidate division KSB1 bacterium]
MKTFMAVLIVINSALAVQQLDQNTTVIVDHGIYPTPQFAAFAEYSVDWSGDNVSRMNAVTESYAAIELRTTLCKLLHLDTANPVNIPLGSIQSDPSANAIILWNLQNFPTPNYINQLIFDYHLDQKLDASASFALLPVANRLYIIGSDRIGTLYGVYHFLESYGVRWYAPGEIGEYIPIVVNLTLPAELSFHAPKFYTRGFWAWEDRGTPEFFVWMARNRLNFWTSEEADHWLVQKLGIQMTVGGHLLYQKFIGPDDEYPFNFPLFDKDDNKPDDPYRADKDEYKGDTDDNGVLSYFEAHPEWYGLVDGRRRKFRGDFGDNICSSNADVMAELTRKLVDELATGEWRTVTILNFWALDGGRWCESKECEALGNPTDRLLRMVHQVRQAIVQAMGNGRLKRNIKIIFPMYHETTEPPSHALPENFDYENCIGTFFPISRCYEHFLNDPLCTEYNVPIWKDFLGWAQNEPRYYKGQFYMGEYFNVATTKSLPALYSTIMAHDIPLYYQYNVRHCHYMHVYTSWLGMKRLNNYIFARLLWNPDIDVDELKRRYYSDFYENLAEPMAELYDNLEFALSNIKQLKHYNSLQVRIRNDMKPLFYNEHFRLDPYHPAQNDGVDLLESINALKKCRELMNDVLPRADKIILKQRLSEDDLNLCYAENMYLFYYHTALSIGLRRRGLFNQARSHYQYAVNYAQKLAAEKVIVQTASSHANAINGFYATGIQDSFFKLGVQLGYDIKYLNKIL